jgi:hypothetical protein
VRGYSLPGAKAEPQRGARAPPTNAAPHPRLHVVDQGKPRRSNKHRGAFSLALHRVALKPSRNAAQGRRQQTPPRTLACTSSTRENPDARTSIAARTRSLCIAMR